jgi:dTMP kinase
VRCPSHTWVWSTTTSTKGTSRSTQGQTSGPRPLFIAFEGVEGSGKSTQVQLVAAALRGIGFDPVVTREPGGTAAGEAIRAIALDRDLHLDPVAELMLMLAARAVFVREVVKPALESGRLVLADRYELSTFAYQGGGRRLPMARVREINDLATGGLRPDLSVILDVGVEEGQARGFRQGRDRIENEDLEFHHRVAAAYRELARSEPDVAFVDGRGEIEKVHAVVWEALSARFPETFPPRRC